MLVLCTTWQLGSLLQKKVFSPMRWIIFIFTNCKYEYYLSTRHCSLYFQIILQKMYPLDEIALPGALSIFPFVAQRLESAFPLVCLGLHRSICRFCSWRKEEGHVTTHNRKRGDVMAEKEVGLWICSDSSYIQGDTSGDGKNIPWTWIWDFPPSYLGSRWLQ